MLAGILLFFEILLYCAFLIGSIFCGFILLIFFAIVPFMGIAFIISGIICLYEWLHHKYLTWKQSKEVNNNEKHRI